MIRGKLNRGERPQVAKATILAERVKPFVCRDCKEACTPKQAIGTSKRRRCPRCGGILDRGH